ncbi:MAG: hypothetical protein KDI46_07640 [Alphaproteobacteria bacterium]|nr:hypothetical protein [Alphaproteobacteria bacterium]MCB1651906.1 hypothetical protein [Alphaproteobacteria bacterium]
MTTTMHVLDPDPPKPDYDPELGETFDDTTIRSLFDFASQQGGPLTFRLTGDTVELLSPAAQNFSHHVLAEYPAQKGMLRFVFERLCDKAMENGYGYSSTRDELSLTPPGHD